MIKHLIWLISACLLMGCHSNNSHPFRVGTISGPETQLMEVAKTVAKEKYGLDISIIEFTDYVEPNAALSDGSLEANMFQHQPYLDEQNHDHHYDLVSVGKTFVYPMGVYSKKITALTALSDGAIVALPNDPSNEGRALLLLQKAALIHLKPGADLLATPIDIIDNPKHLVFKELDASQLPRSLSDVTLAVINTNYAIPAGLSPTKDALFHEGNDSPYANIIAVRQNELQDPRVKELVSAFQSQEVLEKAKTVFNGQAIPAWK